METEQKKKIILAVIAICVVSLLAGLIYAHRERQKEQPTVMPYQDTTDPVKTADQLKLSDDSARAVTKEIYRIQQTQPTPQVTYYVQAPHLTSGAETVAILRRKSQR